MATYDPNDYSQAGINRGQRKINGELCNVDRKIIVALMAIRDALACVPGCCEIHLHAIDAAIADAAYSNRKVAEIKPPGCETPPF